MLSLLIPSPPVAETTPHAPPTLDRRSLVIYVSGVGGELGPCLEGVSLSQGFNVVREVQGSPPDGGGIVPTTCTIVERGALDLRFDRLP